MNVELRHLRYVVTVAEELNFSRAADRLYMGQPALSARMRDLERQLGVRLFDRTTRSVELTSAGEAFVVQARLALSSVDTAISNAQSAARGVTGTLRLGFFAAALLELTGPLLDTLHELAPRVEVQLRQYTWIDPTAGLAAGEVDTAIVRPPFNARGLRLREVMTEPRVLAVHRRHHLADSPGPISFQRVLHEPITSRVTADEGWRDFWLGASHRSAPPETTLAVRNLDEEMQAVASGRAVSLTAAGAARFYRRPGVVFLGLTDVESSVISLAHRHPSQPLAALVERATDLVLARHPAIVAAIANPWDSVGHPLTASFEPPSEAHA